MKQLFHQKAIFLDRDGILNKELGDYCSSIKQCELVETTLDAMQVWSQKGFIFIVITNQAGIAKQLYSELELEAIHQYIQGACIARGMRIEAFYHCPHHPEYSGKCLCRKPNSLNIERAIAKYKIDVTASYFFGDTQRDIDAASNCGIKAFLIPSNSAIPADLVE